MALAYFWGLFLAIYLMGHGLVAMPRRLFRDASVSRRLRRIHKQAPKIHDKLQDAVQEQEDVENQVAQLQLRNTGTARDFKDWIEELAEASSFPESRPTHAERTSRPSGGIPTVITERYLADLTRRLKRAKHRRVRFIDEWDYLVRNAEKTQAILDSSASKQLDFGQPSPHASFIERITILTPYIRYIVYVYIQPGFLYLLTLLGAFASVSIIWSEIVKAVDTKFSIINLTVVHHSTNDQGKVGFVGQFIAIVLRAVLENLEARCIGRDQTGLDVIFGDGVDFGWIDDGLCGQRRIRLEKWKSLQERCDVRIRSSVAGVRQREITIQLCWCEYVELGTGLEP